MNDVPGDPAASAEAVEMTVPEWMALAAWVASRAPDPAEDAPDLRRLVAPFTASGLHWPTDADRIAARNALLREVCRRRSPWWAWDETTWAEAAGPPSVGPGHASVDGPRRLGMLALGRRVGGYPRLHITSNKTRLRPLADLLHGADATGEALDTICGHLRTWAVSEHEIDVEVVNAVLDVMIHADVDRVQHVTTEHLLAVLATTKPGTSRSKGVTKISRVLTHLRVIDRPITNNTLTGRGPRPQTLASVPPEWLAWAQRWRPLARQEPSSVRGLFSVILIAGRWAAEKHPEAVSPESWTRDIAAEYVADTLLAKIGDWAWHNNNKTHFGKPLTAVGRMQRLDGLRVFFTDLIEWEWIAPKFDPARVLTAPLHVRSQRAANPRIIDDAAWAKLMAAGLTLNPEDLDEHGTPSAKAKGGPRRLYYPIEMVRAIVGVWLFAGLRVDELRRLHLDCVTWDTIHDKDTDQPFTACLLHVPANKTSPPFTKPVDPVVGQLIEAWQQVRPPQPDLEDRKTGQFHQYLFSYRGQGIGSDYINGRLLPALCRKAGIPESDSRGALTSHRARATIATQLLNARDPLSLDDLRQWLGHKHPESTRYYAQILQRTLTAAYQKAEYFTRNVRTIQVLIDRDSILTGAAAGGEPWKYYDLGDGWCTYDFFAKCPHRLACARCPFYLPKDSHKGQLLAIRDGIEQMLEQLELTDDERFALQGDRDAVAALVDQLTDTPTPAGPTPRDLGRTTSFIPLTQLTVGVPTTGTPQAEAAEENVPPGRPESATDDRHPSGSRPASAPGTD
ncbi:tyrosine-type recombinase/integrase [Longispora sp. K20-0274]|uniref:tyrosine-type recombinase/integrase n=1 Tax=Longispora sp. K20-0274 TaxID=3088255 RepID=UPI00399C078C